MRTLSGGSDVFPGNHSGSAISSSVACRAARRWNGEPCHEPTWSRESEGRAGLAHLAVHAIPPEAVRAGHYRTTDESRALAERRAVRNCLKLNTHTHTQKKKSLQNLQKFVDGFKRDL